MYEYFTNANGDLYCPYCENYVVVKTTNPDGSVNRHQNTMYYHYKTHEGPFTCRFCNKEYKNEFSLREHMADRHPTEGQPKDARDMFTCPVAGCGYQSKNKGNRILHFMRNHCAHTMMEYEVNDDANRHSTCALCQKQCNSKTSFVYHLAKCLLQNNVNPHPLLSNVV